MAQVAQAIESIRTDIKCLHVKFGGLSSEVGQLRGEVKGLHVEVGGLRQDLQRFENTMTGNFAKFDDKFSNLQSSVDRYFKRTEAWHDEQVILKSRHDRLSDVLVGKGVVTKEEILL